jgi:hypothetical protein
MVSLATVKQLLRMSGTDFDRDSFISSMIPIVYADIIEEVNDTFPVEDYSIEDDDIYFDSTAGVYTINLAAGGFTALNFPNTGTLLITGSRLNDGLYTIASQTNTKITVTESVNSETQPTIHYPITLQLVNFPKPFELIASRMIGYQLSNSNSAGIVSMSLGNYSESRTAGTTNSGYPDEIIKSLSKWKKMRTGRGTIQWHINENRTYFPKNVSGYEGGYGY